MPEESVMAQLSIDNVKVDKLVHEFLTAQSLTIFPQNSFGDAVGQFVDKDDKHAMEVFVNESLTNQIKHLLDLDDADEDKIANAMDHYRSTLEKLWSEGHLKNAKRSKTKPKPPHWDSDLDGHWADQPGAVIISDDEVEEDEEEDSLVSAPSQAPSRRGRGGKTATASRSNGTASRKTAAATSSSKTTAAKASKRAKKGATPADDEEDEDAVMVIDDDEDEEEFPPRKPARGAAKAPTKRAAPARTTATRPPARQAKLNFTQSQSTTPQRSAANRAKVAHDLVSLN